MNTQQLKELAKLADSEVTWILLPKDLANDGWCTEVVNYISVVSPSTITALVDRIEAAERERDELRDEIARRDAAAGEPVSTQLVYSSVLPKFIGDTDEIESYSCFISGETPPRKTMTEAYADAKQVCGELYTAALPVALAELEQDVKNIIGLLSENEWAEHCTKSELGRKLEGEITRLHDLRAQQQKVVELPEPVKWPEIPFKYFSEEQVFSMLDAASVKWEVKT
ncbi:hypothetical protein AI28_20405 [bacteria symbiont BFo1 of Frankliniella occidentalis]|nr:hypothetical protein AI28_20405 [bacteria symbiont BFo1 of Frankliniella occidentalis]